MFVYIYIYIYSIVIIQNFGATCVVPLYVATVEQYTSCSKVVNDYNIVHIRSVNTYRLIYCNIVYLLVFS